MIVGFTGTRIGLTTAQSRSLRKLLSEIRPSRWLHGACRGADEESVVAVGIYSGCHVVALPGRSASGPEQHDLQSQEAIAQSQEVRPVATHFARNRHIVNECALLVACPATMEEKQYGGTWYTVQYARKVGRPIAIVWPDGSVTKEQP